MAYMGVPLSELRDGSYLKDNDSNIIPFRHSMIEEYKMQNPMQKIIGGLATQIDFRPIPLTAKLLQDIGFVEEKTDEGVKVTKDKFSLIKRADGYYLYHLTHKTTLKVEYLHLLQLYYFDIFEKDMQIEL